MPGDFMKYVVKHIDNYEQIECILNGKCIGYVNYRFVDRNVWLNKIKVDREYRGRGIGKTLLKLFENHAYDMRRSVIEGKFYPEDEDGLVVKRFYESNGYSIRKEGYETELFKVLREKHDISGVDVEYEKTKSR